jgi:hypothetical protein
MSARDGVLLLLVMLAGSVADLTTLSVVDTLLNRVMNWEGCRQAAVVS